MIGRWVARGASGATTTDIEVAESEEAFSVKARFVAPGYAQMPQPRMLVFRAAPIRHLESPLLTEKTRKYPVELDLDALQETVRVALPAGFKVDETPQPVHLTTPFGLYEATWVAEPGTLVFRRKLEVQARSVPVSDYAELRKFLDAVTVSAEAPVVLVK